MSSRPLPFSFIDRQNLERVVPFFVERGDKPWIPALVARYLEPELAQGLLSRLPPGLRAEAAMESAVPRPWTREQIAAVDFDLTLFLQGQ